MPSPNFHVTWDTLLNHTIWKITILSWTNDLGDAWDILPLIRTRKLKKIRQTDANFKNPSSLCLTCSPLALCATGVVSGHPKGAPSNRTLNLVQRVGDVARTEKTRPAACIGSSTRRSFCNQRTTNYDFMFAGLVCVCGYWSQVLKYVLRRACTKNWGYRVSISESRNSEAIERLLYCGKVN